MVYFNVFFTYLAGIFISFNVLDCCLIILMDEMMWPVAIVTWWLYRSHHQCAHCLVPTRQSRWPRDHISIHHGNVIQLVDDLSYRMIERFTILAKTTVRSVSYNLSEEYKTLATSLSDHQFTIIYPCSHSQPILWTTKHFPFWMLLQS